MNAFTVADLSIGKPRNHVCLNYYTSPLGPSLVVNRPAKHQRPDPLDVLRRAQSGPAACIHPECIQHAKELSMAGCKGGKKGGGGKGK